MDWSLVAVRWVQFAATIALFGVFAFECLILGPALATAGIGPAASSLDRRLRALAWTSLVLMLASGAAWLAAVTATMSGEPVAVALSRGVWEIVLTQTDFGTDCLVRLCLAGAVALCLGLGAGRRSEPARWAGLLAAAPLLAALAWAGHGAATPGEAGRFHLAADILHLLAAGLWLGMLLPFALLLAEARRQRDAGWAAIAGAATHRFSALGIGSVLVLLASGIVNASFLVGSFAALVGTEYGRVLLAKLAVFLAMLAIAAVNLLRLTPRLARANERAGEGGWRAAAWLRRNALAEAALGLAVLAIVGALGILPPGTHSGTEMQPSAARRIAHSPPAALAPSHRPQ
jgi:copper resistance protein D